MKTFVLFYECISYIFYFLFLHCRCGFIKQHGVMKHLLVDTKWLQNDIARFTAVLIFSETVKRDCCNVLLTYELQIYLAVS